MRAPSQRKPPLGKLSLRHRLMILATRIGRTRNHPPHEPKPRIASQRLTRQPQHGILPGTTGSNHQNKHRPTPIDRIHLAGSVPADQPARKPAMQVLKQPGPTHPSRIDAFRGTPHTLHFALNPGDTLNHAITAPLVAAGFQSGTVTFRNTALNPFRYVMPGPADNDSHVAYFTAPSAPPGTTRIEQANATFGWSDGKPFIHCHAAWTEPNGSRRGGHILPHETIIAEPGEATAWVFDTIRIEAKPDPETNFTLFQPTGTATTGSGLIARIKPNQDILTAIETIARTHNIQNATVRGSLGSLIGASFTHSGHVNDHATEVLVRQGHIKNGKAALDLLVVDMQGHVHEGWLRHGENPVCITFDLILA
jgi:predicted DNA-binding protein with PD1-like motif